MGRKPPRDLADTRADEPSERIRERVSRARELQRARFGGRANIHANAHIVPGDLTAFCAIGQGSDALLRTALSRLGLSARAYHRVIKIARTIADLEGGGEITTAHLGEAIQYRSLDRGSPHAPAAAACA
jgi:magnesium chelatase family protein